MSFEVPYEDQDSKGLDHCCQKGISSPRIPACKWWISGNIFNNQITWSYDNAQGNGLLVTEVNDRKNLETSNTITSRVGFTYDQLARIVTTTDWLQPGTKADAFELKYLYADGVDRRTGTEARFAKFNTTTGAQTNNYFDFRNSYVWDRLNRVDTVTQRSASDPLAATWTANASTTRTVDLNYFADSTLQSISRTQGAAGATTAAMVTTFTTVADGTKNAGRIASITQSGLTGGNVAYAYTYDDHGRVASFTSPGGTRTYSYDTFDQVTGASGAAQTAEAFSYDTNGNRTNGSVSTGQYNRITSDGTFSYQYDKEGNRTRRTTISTGEYEAYLWDYRQRLVSITRYSSTNAVQRTLTYEYDGLDRRTRRTVRNAAGTVTSQQRFLYDSNVMSSAHPLGGDGALRADEAANWEPVIVLDERLAGEPYQEVDHRYLNGPLIDQVFADETGGNGVLWYLSDTQNTVRDVAKYASTTAGTQATVRNHLEYNTFGIVTSADDPTTPVVNDGDRPGLQGAGNEFSPQRSYTGREPDTATGLIYYRARWFDPRIGRFISEDPIGFAAGDANLSRYVGNSAPNAVDPSGLFGIPASYADLPPEAVASLPANVQNPFWDSEESSFADPHPEVYPPPGLSAHDAKEAAYFDRRAAIRKQIAQLRANNHPDADMIANHLERQLAGESGFGLWFSYNGIGTQIAMNLAEAYAAGGRGSIPARRSVCAVPMQPLIPPAGSRGKGALGLKATSPIQGQNKLAPVKRLPAPSPSSVVRNQFLQKEFEFAQEIVTQRGGNIVGPVRKNLPGIDGHLNGVPIQLKQLTGSSPTAVSQAAVQAGRKAANAGINGLEVFIRAPEVASEAIFGGPIKDILNQQPSLSAINILTKDGWVRIIR